MRPNLLFVLTDHQRADSLGASVAGDEVTPNLHRLASRGAVFDRAYTAPPIGVPARTALATGLYPTVTGVTYNDWAGETAGDFTPIHQVLAEAGYETAHFGVDHVKIKPTYRERGQFSLWVDFGDHRRYLEECGLESTDQKPYKSMLDESIQGMGPQKRSYSNTRVGVWPHTKEHFRDSYFCRLAADFIRQPRSTPFALFLYLWAPHPPLEVPQPHASMFEPGDIPLPENVGVPADGEPASYSRSVARQLSVGITREHWRKVWAAHLGLTRLADDGIGEVLSALSESGLTDNSVIVYTSDHGENLGQHQMFQKMEMYEEAVRIPLVIAGPGITAAHCAVPVSHLDVAPTLIGLLGLSCAGPGGTGSKELADVFGVASDGRSLRTYLQGGAEPVAKPIFIQYSGNSGVGDLRRAIVDGKLKYVHDGEGGEELFDLEIDPTEMTNIVGDPAQAGSLNRLRGRCAEWARSHGDSVVPPEKPDAGKDCGTT